MASFCSGEYSSSHHPLGDFSWTAIDFREGTLIVHEGTKVLVGICENHGCSVHVVNHGNVLEFVHEPGYNAPPITMAHLRDGEWVFVEGMNTEMELQ